ncbi:MAG: UDP-N-acetylmuramoyl-L-alanine--D-glutamate ligase [bacterium]|nr:UDP-N-acetylmuramoyl-L-alanine--D-glutamate ligase [bacterium]
MVKAKEIAKRKATTFEFISAKFNKVTREAQFNYRVCFENLEELNFVETLIFPQERDIVIGDDDLIQTALSDLHLVLGVSYYKLYCPSDVVLKRKLTLEQASFWTKLYTEGMGEFYFRNQLDPKKFQGFKGEPGLKAKSWSVSRSARSLVGVGGGKESAVAVELMKEHAHDVTAFVLEARPSTIVDESIRVMSVPSLRVQRVLDPKLFGGLSDTYNGHVPVSAIIAFAGYFAALLYGFREVVVGNEFSSNFGNVDYKGIAVNHQWSKSQVFESAFQKYTRENISPDVEYFSLLRPFYEIRIAQMFSKYKQYFSVFSSCNRNFKIKETTEKKWCGECAKCVFVFTLLSAFLTKKELVGIFGANLYDNKKLLPIFRDLLGIGRMKPFDCVGTFTETRVAFEMSAKKYGKTPVQKALLGEFKVTGQERSEVMQMQKTELQPPYLLYGVNNILLVGYAREGVESEKFLKKHFPKIKLGIADKKFGDDYLAKQNDFDLVIKTAGMPGRLIKIPYTTATNLFFANVDRRKVIGVTGTKGKSTTATLIAWIIEQSGRPVQLLGNIGKPMLHALDKPLVENELVVLELSSYQLEDLQFSPHIAVVTNLFPEHMDYHGDVKKYYHAKKQIITTQTSDDLFVYNADDERLVGWAKKSRAKTEKFVVKLPLKDKEIPLLGEHNKRNVRTAVTVARHLGINDAVIAQAIKTFTPLKHRLQFVGEYHGIKFYDDAISTTPESTIQALETLKKVATIFLGGQDRGYDFSELRKSLKKYGVKNVVLFPDSGEKIIDSAKGFENVLKTSSMKEAVKFAYKFTKPGEICLLSCASPSYSIWKDFEEKGDLFQEEVKKQAK